MLLLRLDPILYKKCQGDAARLCHTHGWNETSEMMPPGAIFSCLYRHAYRSVEQGRRVSLCPWRLHEHERMCFIYLFFLTRRSLRETFSLISTDSFDTFVATHQTWLGHLK